MKPIQDRLALPLHPSSGGEVTNPTMSGFCQLEDRNPWMDTSGNPSTAHSARFLERSREYHGYVYTGNSLD